MAKPKKRARRGKRKQPTVKGAQLLVGNWDVFKRAVSGTETSIGKAYVESLIRGNSPAGTTEHWALTSTSFQVGESLVVRYVNTTTNRTQLLNFKAYAVGKTYIEATCVPRSVVDTI